MPEVRTSLWTALPPDRVLRVLTDFGPARAEAWPGVDASNLTVHDSGPGWAEVTEGNRIGWERERYHWDAEAGTVTADTLASNLWAVGSRWDYRLTPDRGGTTVEVTLLRRGKGVKGALVGALLPLVGARMIRDGLTGALLKG
ncbi:Polyketide cyclase / dehydrase and lipid transport [Friedmanniella luteola]|uniref:Polyketide cyclase / dehydrase and lipid transport n=1 Tax=Friedmanniella luteola TaxID=546871 RepID=A0A1H1VKV3_9ACTN|nr:SRPBCC family protein [Friedmanniella luteola]SDS84669.1 Polyketide cyclase / dehydrase and lipid transport [Friedmanniella luteola]